MANNCDVASTRAKPILPNLLLATTYALNKSNSKRAIVGLEYANGLYKPVVKLCSSGSPSKYVTFDPHSWELVVDQMDAMGAFFQNSYAFYGTFGNPSRVYLPTLDIIYKTSYGSKSICFEQRPLGLVLPSPTTSPAVVAAAIASAASQIGGGGGDTSHAVSSGGIESASSQAPPHVGNVDSTIGGSSCVSEARQSPPFKRQKRYDTIPSVTIQEPTFVGFRDVRECINTRMTYLLEISVVVNRIIDHVILYLHKKLATEETERVKNILRDASIFQRYFMANYAEIHAAARRGVESSSFTLRDQTINILILELTAYGLPWILKHVCELVQRS